MSRAHNFSAGPAALPLEVLNIIRDDLPDWQGTGMSVMEVSHRSKDFVELAARFDGEEGIAALELNISCPNVHAGGMHFGVSGKAAAEVTGAVRAVSKVFIPLPI